MYNRTQNENGTYNSRCLDCFMTIAFSIDSEDELEMRECNHICPEKALAQLLLIEKTSAQRAERN